MRVWFVIGVGTLLVGSAAWSSAPGVAAQGALPDAPGRDATLKVCGNCHGADTVASVRLTPDGWREMIARMVAAGARGTDQELDMVFQYLSTQFPVDVQKPLDLNTAPAVELEAVAGLLRRESAALIAHRQKNGPCRTLEDLRKVPGLDYKKLEARKARLVCM